MLEGRRVPGVFPAPQRMEEPVRHDHNPHPGQPDDPADDHVGQPVMAQIDPAEAHRDDEDHTRGDQADPGAGPFDLQTGQVHHEGDYHCGVERVTARERRRGLVGRHGVGMVRADAADHFLAQGCGSHRRGGRAADQDQRPPAPGGEDQQRRQDAAQDGHPDAAADVGEPGDKGVQAGAAQLFHERQGRLVEVREPGVVHHVVVDLGTYQRQDHHHHAADQHGDPQGRVGHHPFAPAPRQPGLCSGGHGRLPTT